MSRLHKGSKPCGDVAIREMAKMPDTCTDIEDAFYIEIPPVNSVSDSSSLSLEFAVNCLAGCLTDVGATELYMQFQVLHEDGTVLEKDEKVGPVNCMAQALVSQTDVYINDVLVTRNNTLHGYRGYYETTYGNGVGRKTSMLENQLYHQDTHGDAFDQTSPLDTPINSGFIQRAALIAESRIADVIWRPHTDLFMQKRPLPSNANIRLKLTRSSPEFCLMASSGKRYMIKIIKAVLYVRMIKPNAPVLSELNTVFEKNGKIHIPIKKVEMTSFVINAGMMNHNRPNLVTGRLPGRIMIGLTTHKAFNGSYDRSPFRFSPFALNKINLICNGKSIPTRPYTPNFLDKNNSGMQYARCYEALAKLAGPAYSNEGNNISKKAYADGFTLFVFNLSEDWSDDTFGLVKDGIVQLEMGFAEPTPEVLNAVVYLDYEDTISIDKHGIPSIDDSI